MSQAFSDCVSQLLICFVLMAGFAPQDPVKVKLRFTSLAESCVQLRAVSNWKLHSGAPAVGSWWPALLQVFLLSLLFPLSLLATQMLIVGQRLSEDLLVYPLSLFFSFIRSYLGPMLEHQKKQAFFGATIQLPNQDIKSIMNYEYSALVYACPTS